MKALNQESEVSKLSIIFLDVDGVLACTQAALCIEGDHLIACPPSNIYVLEKQLISNLRTLIEYGSHRFLKYSIVVIKTTT